MVARLQLPRAAVRLDTPRPAGGVDAAVVAPREQRDRARDDREHEHDAQDDRREPPQPVRPPEAAERCARVERRDADRARPPRSEDGVTPAALASSAIAALEVGGELVEVRHRVVVAEQPEVQAARRRT